MTLITATIENGQPIEAIVIDQDTDTGTDPLTVTFNTTAFATKESVDNALNRIREFLQGWTQPPNERS